MTWRKPKSQFDRDKGAANRASLEALAQHGPPPGILAYDREQPIGWCAVAPRQEYIRLAKSRVLRPLDEAPVWSVSCFFVAKPYRRQGVSVQLLEGRRASWSSGAAGFWRATHAAGDGRCVGHLRLDGCPGRFSAGGVRSDAKPVGKPAHRQMRS